jgi:hypothetical protein
MLEVQTFTILALLARNNKAQIHYDRANTLKLSIV